jgi:hypothetical protein
MPNAITSNNRSFYSLPDFPTTISGWSLFQYANLFKDILCILALAVSPVIHVL